MTTKLKRPDGTFESIRSVLYHRDLERLKFVTDTGTDAVLNILSEGVHNSTEILSQAANANESRFITLNQIV